MLQFTTNPSPRASIPLSFTAVMKELSHLLSDQKEPRGHRRIISPFAVEGYLKVPICTLEIK